MPAGVYLHIPFCKSRCSYCDFATDVYRSGEAVERYVEALCREITEFEVRPVPPSAGSRGLRLQPVGTPVERKAPPATTGGTDPLAEAVECEPDTVYFGGGTPSLLSAQQAERVLNAVGEKFRIGPEAEITMEMNPATVTPESLKAYRSLGVNRASFGVQTFDDRELKRLARGHDAKDARDTFAMLRDAGFDNISFDLIAGLPRQTLADWERNLDEAMRMQPEHLSLYLLEIHEGTPLAEQVRSGRQPSPDEDLAAAMYETMLDRVTAAGYEQYEISNFARPGFESRHNSKYWRLDPVYGFGVSAHSFDGRERYANERDTAAYVKLIGKTGSAEVTREPVDTESEFIFLGLRMTEGVDLRGFEARFGSKLDEKYAEQLDELTGLGLVEFGEEKLRLTRRGMLYSNEVFSRFV